MITLPNLRCTGVETSRPVALLPTQFDAVAFGLRHPAPTDRDPSARDRQRAEFLGVDGELVERDAERLRRLRLEQHRRPVDGDLIDHANRTAAELQARPTRPARRRASLPRSARHGTSRAPAGGPRTAPGTARSNSGMAGGLPCHRLDHGEQVLRAMGELAHQQAQMSLVLLAGW